MEKMTILIAEDEKDIVELLTLYLESNNFNVISVNNGLDALEAMNNKTIHLLLVDIMMPKMNGYELIKKVRETSDIPIIIMSAKSFDNDRILGLDIGADAYITKPFNPLEVVAYVKSNIRRCYSNNEKNSKNIVIGELILDQEKFQLTKNGNIISLTTAEYKILSKLMSYPEQIFTKAQLYEMINGEKYANDENTMMVHISNIRSKIEDDPNNPIYIKTVRGLGYKIENKKEK